MLYPIALRVHRRVTHYYRTWTIFKLAERVIRVGGAHGASPSGKNLRTSGRSSHRRLFGSCYTRRFACDGTVHAVFLPGWMDDAHAGTDAGRAYAAAGGGGDACGWPAAGAGGGGLREDADDHAANCVHGGVRDSGVQHSGDHV